MKRLTPDDMRDALAYMRATATGDLDGRTAVGVNCDPARMVDCITAYALGLATDAVEGGPIAWLDMLTANVDELNRLASEAQQRRLGDQNDDDCA